MSLTDTSHFAKSRFYITLNTMVTPKMFRSLTVVADSHGVKVPFMVRTILMNYLDTFPNVPVVSEWRDETGSRCRTVQVTLPLTESIRNRTNQIADYQGVSMGQVVRNAVRDYLSRHPATRPLPQKRA